MEELKDKFALTREDNVFVAKKYLKDSVYRSAFLEGIAVTFPQTEAILDNAEVSDVSTKDIAKVFGLRDGWRYVLDNLDAAVDLKMLMDIHQVVAREDVSWNRLGVLRTENVRISGTNFMPEIPNAEKMTREIAEIMSGKMSDTAKAISLMLYIMRTQPFLDGNKRVGTLICNKIMVSRGRGIFSLPPELKQRFTELLVKYYESGDMTEVGKFVYENCITGISLAANPTTF